jgi:arylsulfatase A-like enzyme
MNTARLRLAWIGLLAALALAGLVGHRGARADHPMRLRGKRVAMAGVNAGEVAGLLAEAGNPGGKGEGGRKPNFVIIFIDDMGYGDIGSFGATLQKTPNLDRMAREGIKLTSFYAAPLCSVSRAQLLTGCYGPRISVPGVFHPADKHGLNPAEVTVAERLKAQGYTTECIGKWHLGDQPEFLPTRQGFDHYFGIPYSNDMFREAKDGRQVLPLLRDDKVEELLEAADVDRIEERYTDEAVKFIREAKDRPFLLYFPHTAVHAPMHPGAAFRGKSKNGLYGDWVEELDDSVGRVMKTLRETGLDNDTLVLFTSDNGPAKAQSGSAGPLRGAKSSTWEGGLREPTLVRWPGRIEPGSASDAVSGTIDILPTLVRLAGGETPPDPVIDGRDLAPVLFGKSQESPREAHYYFDHYQLQAVRQGPWKLAVHSQPDEDAKEPRLYNLDDDPGESVEVSRQHPDIVARLSDLAKRMDAEIGGKHPRARRPPGEAVQPRLLFPGNPKDDRD